MVSRHLSFVGVLFILAPIAIADPRTTVLGGRPGFHVFHAPTTPSRHSPASGASQAALTAISAGTLKGGASRDGLTNAGGFSFTLPGAGAQVGASVAVAGDVNGDGYSDLIVGAPSYSNGQSQEGEALLFLGGPSGYSSTPSWTFESNVAGANLGYSVAPAGDVNGDGYADVIVGAPNLTSGLMTNAGRAYVFLGGPSGLSSTPAWTYDGPQAHELCGWSVCTAGDVNGDGYDDVIEGSPGYQDITLASQRGGRFAPTARARTVGTDRVAQVAAVFNNGRARVFYGGPSGLASTPAWEKSGFQYSGAFGFSVSTANDIDGDGYDDVVIGSPHDENLYTSTPNAGEIDAFMGSASGLSLTAATTVPGHGNGELFGFSVAGVGDLDGDGYADVAAGSPGYSDAVTSQGAVTVYRGSASGMDPEWDFIDEGPVAYALSPGGQFGSSVAPAGDTNGDGFADFVAGAPYYNSLMFTHAGYVAVYEGSPMGTGSLAHRAWTGSGGPGAEVGYSVCAAGDEDGDGFGDVAIGFPTISSNDGRVSVYRGGGDMPQTAEAWRVTGGGNIFGVGDFNGDGFDDLATNVWTFGDYSGDIDVYFGSPSGPPAAPSQTLSSATVDGDDQTYGVNQLGDVNGDGYDDLAVMTTSAKTGLSQQVILPGGSSGIGATPMTWSLSPEHFTRYLWPAGDINGDGFADVLVGDSLSTQLFLGGPAGPSSTPTWTLSAGLTGWPSVLGVGDVDGDGFDDLVISDPHYSGSLTDQGRVQVFPGNATGVGTSPIQTELGGSTNSYLWCVGTAGDVNGDGLADFFCEDGDINGGVDVFYGTDALPMTSFGEDLPIEGYWPIEGADLDDDGFSDVVLGGFVDLSPDFSQNLWVFRGSQTGASTTAAWTLSHFDENDGQGLANVAGDFNGDGFPDIQWWHGTTHDGPPFDVEIIYGNGQWTGTMGLDRDAHQVRDSDLAPISVVGASDQPNGYRLHARGRSAAGRTRVRMQSETHAWGTDFNIASLNSTTWQPLPAPGASGSLYDHFDQELTGLSAGTGYKWRTRIASHSPFFPWTPWLTPARNGRQQADLRTPMSTSGVPVMTTTPGTLELSAPAPNPMREETTLRFTLPTRTTARLEVFDLGGRRIARLADGAMDAGSHSASWNARTADGRRVAEGVYFVQLVTPGAISRQKLVVVR